MHASTAAELGNKAEISRMLVVILQANASTATPLHMTECKYAHTKRSADKMGSAGHIKRSN